MVEASSITPCVDWPISGPRAVEWVMRFLDRRGGGPSDHHAWWSLMHRLSKNDWGVGTHRNGLRALELARNYDGLEVANVASLEIIARRVQMVEYCYARGPAPVVGDAASSKDSPGGGPTL